MAPSAAAWARWQRRFPGLRAAERTSEAAARAEIRTAEWRASDALLGFDQRVHAAEDRARDAGGALWLCLELDPQGEAELAAEQILLRYQRWFARPNRHSGSPRFARWLERFCAMHDLSKPLVRADYDHALDVWQWILALRPDASEALQVAGLFHDIERLVSEADRRVEQHAADYPAFKQRHAARGAELLREVLSRAEDAGAVVDAAVELVRRHEVPDGDPELALLNDADALSFFSLNSPGYLAYFGPAKTREKVLYTLGRMSARAIALLREARLPTTVRALVEAEACGSPRQLT